MSQSTCLSPTCVQGRLSDHHSMENDNGNSDSPPIMEVNSFVVKVNNFVEPIMNGKENGEDITDIMSDDTLPADDTVEDLKPSLEDINDIKSEDTNDPDYNPSEDALHKNNRSKNAGRTTGTRKRPKSGPESSKPGPKSSKPGPKSSKRKPKSSRPGPKALRRTLSRRISTSDRKYSTLITLGPHRRINVCIEITGIDGGFGRVDGEVVFAVPVKSYGSEDNQWKLTDILKEVMNASATVVDPADDPNDPYGPLLNDDDDDDIVDPAPYRRTQRRSRAKAYDCSDCRTTFGRKSDLTVHQRNGLCPALKGPFLCDECGLTLTNSAAIRKHRKTHERALCHLCGKTFPVGQCMKQHMITHAGHKPFDCDICGAQFRSKTARELHVSRHNDDRPHICQMCAASFKRLGLLKRHIKFVHNEEAKNILCKTCGKAFRSQSDMRAHMPSHTGEKPYGCDQCGKRFAYKVCLSDHVKTVHSDVRAYKCSECDKAFKTSSMLASHRRSHTKQSSSYSLSKRPKVSNTITGDDIVAAPSDFAQCPMDTHGGDFTSYTQQSYIPQAIVGDYDHSVGQNNVFSPLRYLDLSGPPGHNSGQKANIGHSYRDSTMGT